MLLVSTREHPQPQRAQLSPPSPRRVLELQPKSQRCSGSLAALPAQLGREGAHLALLLMLVRRAQQLDRLLGRLEDLAGDVHPNI